MRMHATIADKPHEMKLPLAPAGHCFEQQRLALEFAAGDEGVHARDVHANDAAGADIQVAHFAIAHLPFGQADRRAGSANQRVGKVFQQAIVIRLAREMNCVALRFGGIAPAVENGEDDGLGALKRGHGASGYTEWAGDWNQPVAYPKGAWYV